MPEDGVFGEITTALRRAFADLDYPGFEEFKYEEIGSKLRFAFRCGEAGGIAAVAGLFGLSALELCDDISDAWEEDDNDFLLYILNELMERPNQQDQTYARVRDTGIDWGVRGAVLDDAIRSYDEGDDMRYHLMCGFVSGLMFNGPGPRYEPDDVLKGIVAYHEANHPELTGGVQKRVEAALGTEREELTLRDGIVLGWREGCRELVDWARAGIAFGVRMGSPAGGVSGAAAERAYEERVRTMRWAQNFGLRKARARDGSVSIPNAMTVNYWLASGGAEELSEPEWEEYEIVTFDDESEGDE